MQYALGDETVVLAWLQAQRYGEPVPALRLAGPDPAASYECLKTEKFTGVPYCSITGCGSVCAGIWTPPSSGFKRK
ncbi:hypothetical protein SVIOM74S_09008 [Streptomyces violarus]